MSFYFPKYLQGSIGANEVLGTDLQPDYFENPYDFYQEYTQAEILKTKDKLEYNPKFSLAEGVKAYQESGRL